MPVLYLCVFNSLWPSCFFCGFFPYSSFVAPKKNPFRFHLNWFKLNFGIVLCSCVFCLEKLDEPKMEQVNLDDVSITNGYGKALKRCDKAGKEVFSKPIMGHLHLK